MASRFAERLKKVPCLPWILAFLAINMIIYVPNNGNPLSRLAALLSMTEDKTFAIDSYVPITIDWARVNGRTFSNKAPGPILWAYPLYRIMDAALNASTRDRLSRDATRFRTYDNTLHVLSFVYQAIPYAIAVGFLLTLLARMGASRGALLIGALAMLFGNTASLFMNIFFGHAMSAAFVLGETIALLTDRPALFGFCAMNAMLCDYGAMFVAAVGAAVFFCRRSDVRRRAGLVLLGAALPAIAWAVYHQRCFGAVYRLPTAFFNPLFVDTSHRHFPLWGMFSKPESGVLLLLLFGQDRGILWTQGWVFIAIGAGVAQILRARLGLSQPENEDDGTARANARATQIVGVFAVLSLMALLVMNASFEGWHGGNSSGPRYLSPVLPVFGVLLVLVYDRMLRTLRGIAWFGIVASVVLFVLAYSSKPTVSYRPLWPYYLHSAAHESFFRLMRQKLALMVLILGWAALRTARIEDSEKKDGPRRREMPMEMPEDWPEGPDRSRTAESPF